MDGLIDVITSKIGTMAPKLVSLFSNGYAGLALSLLADNFGADKSDLQTLKNKIANDPQAIPKLIELNEKISALNIQGYATEVDDRKNAREMHVKLHDNAPHVLATIFILIWGALQIIAAFYPNAATEKISSESHDILFLIMSFYFGSMFKRLQR